MAIVIEASNIQRILLNFLFEMFRIIAEIFNIKRKKRFLLSKKMY